MSIFWLIIIAATVISLASFSGAFLGAKAFHQLFHRHHALLVSFSAGVFLVAGVSLVQEVFHVMDTPIQAAAYVIVSFVIFHMLSVVLPEHHHHHTDEECCGHEENFRGSARRLLISDTIHNMADGILIVPAFLVSKELGVATAIGIVLHEVVQEISEYIIFRKAGYSQRKTLTLNFLTSLSIFIGVALSLWLLQVAENVEGPLLAVAAGSFTYVVIRDLIPHSVKNSRHKHNYGDHIAVFLLGVLIMMAIGFLSPSHSHTGPHDHNHAVVITPDSRA